MPPRRSSDSLRAVLLSAKSVSGTGSKHGSSALTWHSLRSVGPTAISDPPGHYFPAKLALAMGLVKLFFSLLMVGLGGVAIVLKASISSIGAGVWVGIVVGVSGFLGVCAARRPFAHVYVISFMSVSILSLAASGLLIVLSATAWARDNYTPQILLYDKETESEVDLFGEFLVRRPSILVSGLLVVLGVFDILISLACVALSAREACGANSGNMGVFTNDGHDKKERLYRWLGQQKYIFQSSSQAQKNITSVSQFVPLTSSSGESSPVRKYFSPPMSPTSEPVHRTFRKSALRPTGVSGVSSGNSSEVTNEKRSKSSSGVTHFEKKNSSVIFLQPSEDYDLTEPFLIKRKHKSKAPAPPQHQPQSLPHLMQMENQHTQRRKSSHYGNQYIQHSQYFPLYPQANHHTHTFQSLPCPQHQVYAHHPAIYYPQVSPPVGIHLPIIENYTLQDERRELEKFYRKSEKKRQKEKKKKREAKQKRREERQRRKSEPLTDRQIEQTYTGLDREIAEGFISFAMEPFASKRRSHHSASDLHSESFS